MAGELTPTRARGQGTDTTEAPPSASSSTGADQRLLPAGAARLLTRSCSRTLRLLGCMPPRMLGYLHL